MASQSYQQILSKLEDALAREEYEVTIGEQTVRYASKADIIKAINYYRSQISLENNAGGNGAGRRTRAVAGGRFL